MQRREFLAASTAAALGLATTHGAQARAQADGSGGAGGRQLIELRTYHFASPQKRQAFESFLASAYAPALGRAGVGPVGVFKLQAKDNPDLKLSADPHDLYVLLPHKAADSLLSLDRRLGQDEQFLVAAQEVLLAPKSDPAYVRYESTLMLGFERFPRVEAPTKAPGRVLQLRIYESHSTERAKKKIAMFNEGGEIAIFRNVGMKPVFFGEALAGARLPNLTYMVAFDDAEALTKAWDAFRTDPDWKKLSGDPAYKDTVSNITNMILRPAEGSQV